MNVTTTCNWIRS